jgi:hypothetical protein
LGDALDQFELVAAGQDELGVAAGGVQARLKVGKEIGDVLDLVENRAVGKGVQVADRILARLRAHHRVFEIRVRHVREGVPGEGGLARLARAEQRQSGEAAEGSLHVALGCSGNVGDVGGIPGHGPDNPPVDWGIVKDLSRIFPI